MNHHYDDIRSRIPETPKWWDEQAVPRYCVFTPNETADIYADQVALVEIGCQGCAQQGRETLFLVAFSWRKEARLTVENVQELHYGDPPNTSCCAAGPTMNSIPRRVVEFWRKGGEEFTAPDPKIPGMRICLPGYFDWRRVPELEIAIDCDWAKDL